MLKFLSKPLAASIGVVVALVAFSPASALPVNVTYSMTYAYFAPATATTVLQGTGQLTVEFANGTSGGHVGSGPLHIASGTAMLNGTFTAIVFGTPIMFTGMQVDTFVSGAGMVNSLGAFTLMSIGHIASGMVHCSGALCGLAGFPASNQIALTSGPRSLNFGGNLLGFPSVGPQSFAGAGQGSMTPQGGFQQITVTGQEISRVVVPEPGTGLLLGCGLAGFGIALTYWRRRRA
jgi:hypothetical protein